MSDDEMNISDGRKAKILVMIVLLFVSCFLTYFFHVIFKIEIVFTHFFYIPIILSCFWWKRKGLVVSIFLAVFYISITIWLVSFEEMHFIEYMLRGLMFLLIGVVISLLTEKIFKIQEELKESEEKYRKAYNLVNFYKDLFAHDMSNILQSILSTVEYDSLFRNDPEKLEDFGDITELVKMHVGRGSSLISKVITLSKLEETEIQLVPIGVFDVLNKSMKNTKKSFHKKNINIQIEGLSKDMKILGDELLIEVFDNLLHNALKFSDNDNENIVDITVSKIQTDDIKYIKFEFKDNGIGIPDDRKELLFKGLFKRDKHTRGMGIGLSLVKRIVDKYGGKIWVEDKIKENHKEGSNFIILIPEARQYD